MADAPRSNFLPLLLGAFAAVGVVGTLGVVAVSWVLNRSLESFMDRLFSDTGVVLEAPEEGEDIEELEFEEADLGELQGIQYEGGEEE